MSYFVLVVNGCGVIGRPAHVCLWEWPFDMTDR